MYVEPGVGLRAEARSSTVSKKKNENFEIVYTFKIVLYILTNQRSILEIVCDVLYVYLCVCVCGEREREREKLKKIV